MAQISLQEAADRSGVPQQTLEAWAERGLLTLHERPGSLSPAPGDLVTADKFVDEEELDQVVESLGWLHLSAAGWDGTEEE